MRKADPSTPARRRVGTFTLGVTLVAAGIVMLLAMFLQAQQVKALALWSLRLSPLILIALGIETLLAARGGEKVRYDWLGMLLCFLLTGAALCLFAAAWVLLHTAEYGLPYFRW